MIYKVYFQLYGKKMKINIDADTQEEAKQKIKDSIIFDKIVQVNDNITDNDNDVFKNLKNIMGI